VWFSGLWTDLALRRDQFWNTDQVVRDEVDEKVSGNAGNAAMFGFSHCAVLFSPTEDALNHFTPRL